MTQYERNTPWAKDYTENFKIMTQMILFLISLDVDSHWSTSNFFLNKINSFKKNIILSR
jgi:hypothetical protein